MATVLKKNVAVDQVTNGAAEVIEFSAPYTISLTLEGSADLLFHRWNCDAVEAKAKAAKGSKGKKSDDLESYVWRDDDGDLCIPGEYLRQAVIHAAKYRQDPRSPRKSAMDLFKAGVVSMTQLASIGKAEWDYEDRRRCVVQRNGITRVRPALRAGWRADFSLMVILPEYIPADVLREVIDQAGKVVGLADFRPTFGRFAVVDWERV